MWDLESICYVELTIKNITYVIIICKFCAIVLYESNVHYFSPIITISQMSYYVRPISTLTHPPLQAFFFYDFFF